MIVDKMNRLRSVFFCCFTLCSFLGRNAGAFQPSCRASPQSLRLFSSSSTENAPNKTPIHLLAGFLGAGKTTTLQHLLENTENIKVGIIVNDVASVNIDAKLVNQNNNKQQSALNNNNGIIELQNGCACCSLSDEFLTSVQNLLQYSTTFDAIVVELSGVADPVAIQNRWRDAIRDQHPVTEQADLQNVITVIDSCTFGSDWMTWDIAGDRKQWFNNNNDNVDCTATRKVVELLAEQVEAADLIVLNKVDMAGTEKTNIAKALAQSLNTNAKIIHTNFGKVSVPLMLTPKQDKTLKENEDAESTTHSHSHDHDHQNCQDPTTCTDPSHSHSHDHQSAAACQDSECTDPSHSHSHSHDHREDSTSCHDPNCTDPTHDHSHSSTAKTSTDNLGIRNFVYRADRPFDAERLMKLLFKWPVPIKDELDLQLLKDATKDGYRVNNNNNNDEASPFVGVLRSKGFCWFSPTQWDGILEDTWRHDTAMYWSHAGKHIGIQEAGRWWASVPESTMQDFFAHNPVEMERILREDFVSTEFGDRRQELVFIGVDVDQKGIENALNECLLTDEEMEVYREQVQELQFRQNQYVRNAAAMKA